MAHSTFSGMTQTGLRIFDLEHKVLEIGDAVLNRDRHFNDVLVFGQHLTLLTIGTYLRHVTLELLLDRGEVQVQTRADGAVILTKAQNDRLLLLIDHINGLEYPEAENQHQAQRPHPAGNTRAASAAAARTAVSVAALTRAEQVVQAVLQLAQRLVQVRWTLLAAAISTAAAITATAPGILVVRIVAATRLIPGHSVLRCL